MKKRLLIILVSGILPLSLLADDTYGSKVTPDRGNTVDVSPTTGTSFTLTPNAADGWNFTQWDDGNTDNPRTVPSSALTGSSHEYKAEFEDNRCGLYDKKLDNPSYGGSVSAERSATCECEWTLTATADDASGYSFKGWDDGNTDNPRTVYIDADAWTKKDFKALFERPECSYKMTPGSGDGGSVKALLSDACSCEWEVTAVPHEGWTFSHWNDLDESDPDYAANPRTVSASADVETFTATFENHLCALYTASVENPKTAGGVAYGGTVSAARGTCECDWTLTATPFTGFAFINWTDADGDEVGTSTTLDITIDPADGNKIPYYAHFARPVCNYKPFYSATGGGSVKGELTDACECDWLITATPEEGWTFLRWDDGNTDNPRSINAFYDAETYTAVFEDHRCALFEKKIENPSFGGTVTAVQGTCECDWTLTATAAAGYRFLEWNDGKKTNPRDTTLNPDIAKHVLSATFVPADGLVDAWTADGKAIVRTNALDLDNTTATIITGGTERATGQALTREDAGYWSFAASLNAYKGEDLRIAFYDECDQLVAVIDTVVPYVVSADADLSALSVPANTDVQVVSGTLTVDADATIAALDIYGGAKTVVPTGKTLNVSSVYMRADALTDAYPQLVANGTIHNLNGDTIYYDYTLDYMHYYPLAVPYAVDCSKIRTKSGKRASFEVQWYNGEERAGNDSGWNLFDDQATGATLEAGKGYTVYAVPYKWNGTRHATVDVRFPMVADLSGGEEEKSVAIAQYGNLSYTNASNLNWNFIGNPYLANYTTSADNLMMTGTYQAKDEEAGTSTPDKESYAYSDNGVRYITTTTDYFQHYVQSRAADAIEIKAFNSYFIQAAAAGDLIFTLTQRAQNAPRRVESKVESRKTLLDSDGHRQSSVLKDEVAFGIVLSSATASDRTGMLYGEGFTDDYELNADLVKMSGSTPVMEVYTLSENERRAFNALALTDIRTKVPVGYANAPMGQMTIAFDEEHYDPSAVDAVMLTDYETGQITNLLEGAYTFTNHASSSHSRFALNAVLAPQVATGLNDRMANDRMVNEDGVFDLLGRRVTTDMLPQGVYIIVENGVSRKEVVR